MLSAKEANKISRLNSPTAEEDKKKLNDLDELIRKAASEGHFQIKVPNKGFSGAVMHALEELGYKLDLWEVVTTRISW